MFTETLLPDTIRAIKLIDSNLLPSRTYLAGGSALALQFGHRISVDLDFFTPTAFDVMSMVNEFRKISRFKLGQTANLSILGKIGETRFSLFTYDYPLLKPTLPFENIQLAGLQDIAAMKIHALSDRGTRRDFIDTFFLAKKFTLEEILNFYEEKYHKLEANLYHLIRSLNYFDDAESDKMPEMITAVSWPEIKLFFEAEARRLAKKEFDI